MHAVIVTLAAILVVTSAIVCPPNACVGVKPLDESTCKGSVLKNAGWCGCKHACAKVLGESCTRGLALLGAPVYERCDDGLVCSDMTGMFGGHVGQCVVSDDDDGGPV